MNEVSRFSTRLEAEYAELANSYLDSLRATNLNDFEIIKSALSILLEQNSVIEVEDESLKGKVTSLKELIDEPEIYVQNPIHYEQYRTIIKTRIHAKILEIGALTDEGKLRYIENQNSMQRIAEENHQQMSSATPPTPEDRTLTEEAWLLEMQNLFNQNAINDNLLENPLFAFLFLLRLTMNQEFFNANYRQLIQIPPVAREQIAVNPVSLNLLVQAGVTLNEIINIDDHVRLEILQNSVNVAELLNAGLLFNELVNLDGPLRSYIIDKAAHFGFLMRGAGGLSFQTLTRLNFDLLRELVQNPLAVRTLIYKGGSFDQLVSLPISKVSLILEKYMDAGFLLPKQVTIREIAELDPVLFSDFWTINGITQIMNEYNYSFGEVVEFAMHLGVENFKGLTNLCNLKGLLQAGISLQALQTKDREIISLFMKQAYGISQLIEKGITFNEMICLDNTVLVPFLERGDITMLGMIMDKGNVSSAVLMDFASHLGLSFYDSSNQAKIYIFLCAGISLQTLRSKEQNVLTLFLDNHFRVLELFEAGVSLDDIETQLRGS